LNDPKPKKSVKNIIEKEKTTRPKNWEESCKRQVQPNGNAMKSLTLPYLSQCKLSPFGKIYHVFHKLLSTTLLAKEFNYFVQILSPFDNELIKHKPREVDAMHDIKIRVLHRLYQTNI
jgi:hypothetical protein